MKYFEVGQKVWCFDEYLGIIEGIVTQINYNFDYPISIDFGNNKCIVSTSDGRVLKNNAISLFQTKPIITPNAPIFEERPAYFYHDGSRVWFYDILIKIDELGSGNAKVDGCWYPKWQYEAPTL